MALRPGREHTLCRAAIAPSSTPPSRKPGHRTQFRFSPSMAFAPLQHLRTGQRRGPTSWRTVYCSNGSHVDRYPLDDGLVAVDQGGKELSQIRRSRSRQRRGASEEQLERTFGPSEINGRIMKCNVLLDKIFAGLGGTWSRVMESGNGNFDEKGGK